MCLLPEWLLSVVYPLHCSFNHAEVTFRQGQTAVLLAWMELEATLYAPGHQAM